MPARIVFFRRPRYCHDNLHYRAAQSTYSLLRLGAALCGTKVSLLWLNFLTWHGVLGLGLGLQPSRRFHAALCFVHFLVFEIAEFRLHDGSLVSARLFP